ncbi:MAG: hydrogenase maturation nickel metallochaperone HypA [Gemmataceae bacterium]
MHELSIALSLLDIAREQAERLGASRVTGIHVRLGPLSGVVPEALRSAYELARQGTALDRADLVIEETPLVARCSACGGRRTVFSVLELQCPDCASAEPEIVQGRELEMSALEIEA